MNETSKAASNIADPKPARLCWGLCSRRERVGLNWRGRMLVLLLLFGLGLVYLRTIHPFLAPVKPVPGGVLVVEGWSPDEVLQQAIAEVKRGGYSKLFVTGGPLEAGAPLSEYRSFAELCAATIARMGFDTNQLQAVPAPRVPKDRTYVSAVALKRWLDLHGGVPPKMTLVTGGAHARRSWLLYEKVMGKHTRIGIIAVRLSDYDADHWWRSSMGVRGVLDETIAYIYARFLFWPKNKTSPESSSTDPPSS